VTVAETLVLFCMLRSVTGAKLSRSVQTCKPYSKLQALFDIPEKRLRRYGTLLTQVRLWRFSDGKKDQIRKVDERTDGVRGDSE